MDLDPVGRYTRDGYRQRGKGKKREEDLYVPRRGLQLQFLNVRGPSPRVIQVLRQLHKSNKSKRFQLASVKLRLNILPTSGKPPEAHSSFAIFTDK